MFLNFGVEGYGMSDATGVGILIQESSGASNFGQFAMPSQCVFTGGCAVEGGSNSALSITNGYGHTFERVNFAGGTAGHPVCSLQTIQTGLGFYSTDIVFRDCGWSGSGATAGIYVDNLSQAVLDGGDFYLSPAIDAPPNGSVAIIRAPGSSRRPPRRIRRRSATGWP